MTLREQFNHVYLSANRGDAHAKWLADAAMINDDDIMVRLDGSAKPLAALIAPRYDFAFHDNILQASAFRFFATRPEQKARAAAPDLIIDSLVAARNRGDALCMVVPPQRHLFFFYDRFGFATVFYADELRYTALHNFDGGEGGIVEPEPAMLRGLELRYGCGTIHSDDDFAMLRDELSTIPGAHIIAAADADSGAILIARAYDDNVVVKLLLADSEPLSLTALAELRRLEPGKTFLVDTPPLSGDHNYLRARGMARIVNPMPLLQTLAQGHPGLRHIIRVSDNILPENSACYAIADGRCERLDNSERRPDLDLSVETLTALLFSSSNIGEIFNLPTRRPFLSLLIGNP